MNIFINKKNGKIGILLKGFYSESQRRFMWVNHPDIAKKWAHDIPAGSASSPHRMPTGKSAKIKGKKPKNKKERARIMREARKLRKREKMQGTKTITGATDDRDFPTELG